MKVKGVKERKGSLFIIITERKACKKK